MISGQPGDGAADVANIGVANAVGGDAVVIALEGRHGQPGPTG